MNKFKIDQNVPVPADQPSGRGRPMVYPFHMLKVGESFLVTDKPRTHLSTLIRHHHTRKPDGPRFTCRTVDGGVRVWRIQ